MKPRIFISYKRSDRKKVFALKTEIEANTGEKCWIDLDGIESDAQFKNVIINAIKDCEVVLFMYSRAHSHITDFEKDWTVRELNFAASKGKRIVFVNIDGTPLTDEFSFDYGLKQQVNGQSAEAIARLIADLKKWLKPIQNGNKGTEQVADSNIPQKTFNFGILGKRKGCIVAVLILASVFLLVIPSFWMFNSSSPTLDYNTSDVNTDVSTGNPNYEQLTGIDLGLPSGTLWANMNVGADNLSDYGDLFSWGESQIKTSYSEYDYVKETKNQAMGGRHDAASTIFGPEWSTPSVNDFKELIDNCIWSWTSRNGHNGYEVKGSNGNTIFLPASGWIHTDSVEYRNEYGYYWTSNRVNDIFAKGLLFSKSEKKIGNGYLYYGRCIRPVSRPATLVVK